MICTTCSKPLTTITNYYPATAKATYNLATGTEETAEVVDREDTGEFLCPHCEHAVTHEQDEEIQRAIFGA